MPLREEIQRAQQAALKGRDAARLSTLRGLRSAIRTEEINRQLELDDAGVLAVVSRQIKQTEEALKDFSQASRHDLMQKSQAELEILKSYMPPPLSDEQLSGIIDKQIAECSGKSASDIGRVVGAVMKEVKGRADGHRVRELVTKKLF